ncbi:MAG: GcrA cell cycle regulator [Alphaproteobacteria bacterium]|jgi:GcrA cell cycle regulator|nr:GcrA cell cycle regulator [Alphaproteobacteria bacterium]
MGWTAEKIEQLNKLWSEGMSITEIGKILGMTRNAVVGKAHRLGLAKRPSPIARAPGPRPAAQPAPAAQPTRSVVAPAPAAAVSAPVVEAPVVTAKPALPVMPQPARPRPAPAFRATRVANGPACRWPIGDPKSPDFHFCGSPSIEGKPYCEKHCAMAYSGWSEASEKAEKHKAA